MLQKKKRKKQIGSMGHSKLPHGSGKKNYKMPWGEVLFMGASPSRTVTNWHSKKS